ncbi:MAG TPA: phytanoyl-CoA dioxygenase family protein [Fibrobacteria bacterium]|nr:phytanoyl-CoA dioxygenase family protein [Fibrobacteria bacterium]
MEKPASPSIQSPASGVDGSAFPWIESPFFRNALDARNLSEAERELARHYHEKGYVILKGVLDEALIERLKSEVGPLFDPKVPDGPRSAYRVMDAWKESPSVRAVAATERVLSALRFLYARKPIPFQTLNFLRGSQQRAHSDSIHFSCLPARFMCGAWAALEDVTPENGPLFYYPGSHKLPEFNYYQMGLSVRNQDYRKYEDFISGVMEAQGFAKEHLSARKGDVLIWSSNLVHGGEKILREGSTRWSQVTHYYFEDCLYYTPMLSDFLTGQLFHREIRDITTGAFVEQSFNGRRFSLFPTGGGRFRIADGSDLVGNTVTFARRAARSLKRRLKGP